MPNLNLVYCVMLKDQLGTWEVPRVGRYRKVGERVTIDGKAYRVDMVNPCRARCVPLKKRKVTITDRVFNKARSFMASDRAVNISPVIA